MGRGPGLQAERMKSPGQASRQLVPLTWAWSSPGLCLVQSAMGEAPEGPDNSHCSKKGTQSLSEEHVLDLVCPQGTPRFRGLHPSPTEPEVISELTSAQPWSPLEQGLAYPYWAAGRWATGPLRVSGRAGPGRCGLLRPSATSRAPNGWLQCRRLLNFCAGCEVPLAKQRHARLGTGGVLWT